MKKLNEKKWQSFTIGKLFVTVKQKNKRQRQLPTGKLLQKRYLKEGKTPRISATSTNNGVMAFHSVKNQDCVLSKNFISLTFLGCAFYQPYVASLEMKVHSLKLKDRPLNPPLALFLVTAVRRIMQGIMYGNQLSSTDAVRKKLLLPVTVSGEPDYNYMIEYTKQKRELLHLKYRKYVENRIAELGDEVEIPALSEKQWRRFMVFGDSGIFKITTTNSSIDGIRLIEGKDKILPYVTRSAFNNGIKRFVCERNKSFGYDHSGSITVGLDSQTAYWQSHEFVTGQNIQVITGEHLNGWNAQFLIPLLRMQMRAKFNWGGNGATLERMNTLNLMLPVNDSGEPDYNYMEQYTKNMMLRKYKQYLAFLRGKKEKL